MDDELKEALMDKIDDGSFGVEDLLSYMKLFLEVCNESEDVEEEIEGWDRTFQFEMDGTDDFWLKVEEGKSSSEVGTLPEPDLTLTMAADTAAGIFTGEIDATSAYMSGDLKIAGPLPDAVKFRTITELVREELEE
jgi:putative sterol carrier protein